MASPISVPRASEAVPARAEAEPLYESIDWILVRTPLLPVTSYLELGDGIADLSDPLVRRAVAAGSPSLLAAMERAERSELSRRDIGRMRAKLLRYRIRMSTRPTPYGLFAGVALARCGAATDLRVRATGSRTQTRPDMAWLMELAMAAEAKPAVRRRLEVFSHPLAVVRAGCVCLAERAPMSAGGPRLAVSVRATGVVLRALELARTRIPYPELAERLCRATPSATPGKVDQLLDELWQQTLLLTELRPPLTTLNPARWIAERLERIPEAAEEWKRLDAFLSAADAWDRSPHAESIERFRTLLSRAGAPQDGSKQTPVQVDMAISVEGQIGNAVAAEAARAAELLLRLSPAPGGTGSLEGHRQAFFERYGHAEVPLLELLDPERGLPPATLHVHGGPAVDPVKAVRRARTLLRLACTALHDRQRVVVLDERCLTDLESGRATPATAPLSLDLSVLVAARSAAAIDRGDFKIVIGPNLGGMAAGRNLARFAGLLAPDGPEVLARCAAAEQAHTEDCLWAEIVYLPPDPRLANVVIRPPVRSHEVTLAVSAGVPDSGVIPVNELVVGLEDGRFYVRWPAAGKRVVFSSGHMLNPHGAPEVVRFLLDVSSDRRTVFNSFDWGPAEAFPYLPRAEAGRIVLRPAQWQVRKEDLAGGIDRWRETWDVPRHVCLSFGDNRLILDLEQAPQVAELEAELKTQGHGEQPVILQEVLPALDDAWLRGPGGHYYAELVVPLILRRGVSARAGAPSLAPSMARPASPAAARSHPPGSDWLYVKLYGPRQHEDEVICGSMRTFAENAIASGLADAWFFIRFADPEPHLRVRFHGSPEQLRVRLFAHLCDWAGGLMSDGLSSRFVMDTYEQEVERFGGTEGMAAAETLFTADSLAAAALVGILRQKRWQHDQTTLLALSIDEMLGSLGFGEADRLRWYRQETTDGGPAVGAEYRQRKNVLRAVLGRPAAALAADPAGAEIAAALAMRRSALLPVGALLRELAEQGALDEPLDQLCRSFVHLHINRMAATDGHAESRVLALLLRARESLEKAPMG
jgi:thiopeptide-type bacteriocin biosynthesis protein